MKTVNLELSKALKEAGYPPNTAFEWEIGLDDKPYLTKRIPEHGADEPRYFPSPTADEILDQCKSMVDVIYFISTYWSIEIGMFEGGISPKFEDESLADAAAKAWLYLKKEGLLTP